MEKKVLLGRKSINNVVKRTKGITLQNYQITEQVQYF